ncbi:MAG: hypothetical protein GW859_02570 [Sphingomonadales bacterium]|nr:hypothetical protein [Sphingomonadales bacterium]
MRSGIVIAALLLAGCQQDSEAPVEDVPIKDNGVPAGSDAIVTDAAQADIERSQAATDAEMAQPMGKAFPAAFHGRWDGNAAACAKDYSDMRMTITGDTVKHWESSGTVRELRIETPTRITADLDFSGEGEEWQSTTGYEVVDGGKALVRTQRNPDITVRYVRCS